MRITDGHIADYKRRGYAVVENFLTREELAGALAGFHQVCPTWEEFQAGRRIEDHRRVFPWCHTGLNFVTTHPEIVAAAERIIGTREIKLACSDINGRYATQQVGEAFHIDHGNNTLGPLMPEDHSNITMAMVLTDVRPGMAPTMVVPWGEPDANAIPMTLPAGSLFFYSTNTTRHSASPFTAPSGFRATLWTIWCRKDHAWEGRGWTYKSQAHHPAMVKAFERYIADATPRQMELIGFPAPGAPLWTRAYIEGMAKRYPGFDTRPYLDALDERTRPAA
jgi:hypothetical protein